MDRRVETSEYGIPSPGFRLSPQARPSRVRLQVADLERSLDYYRRVLGFGLVEESARRAALGPMRAEGTEGTEGTEGAEAVLIELHERPGAAPVPRRGRLGLYHYAILLPDRAALGAFVGHLTELGERAGASDHLVSEALYLRDPDGLGIEVYADRPRSEWRHRDRQIVMATEPLDLASLARAAGSESWRGMPAGTRIGHVHLHVGDLDRAESFYHEALGLDKMVWSYPGALFLSAGGYHHHLGLNTWAATASPAGEGDARLLEWELLVPTREDVEGAAGSLESAGHGVDLSAESALAHDAWGTAVRIRTAESSEAGP